MNQNNSKNRNFTSKASVKQKLRSNDNSKEVKKPLRRQIRDAQRLLKNPKLPDDIRQEKELLIAELMLQLKRNKSELKAIKYAKKYKKVKFFEKKKLTRKYLSLCKKLKNCDEDDREDLQEEVTQTEAYLNYVTHFPPDVKYISLFPSKSGQDAKVKARKDEIYKRINEEVMSGKLLPYSSLLSKDSLRSKRQTRSNRLTKKISDSKLDDQFFIIDRKPDEDTFDD